MRTAFRVGILLCLAAGAAAAEARKPAGWVEVDRIAAVVNGDVILASEVTRRVASLTGPGQAAPAGARAQVLDGMIDELLFAQEASRVRIAVSDQEVDGAIAEIKQQNQLDDAALQKALAERGYTMDVYRDEVRRQLLHMRAVNTVVAPRVRLTDEEVLAAYKAAKKADPKLGAFEAEKERIRQRLYQEKMAAEARRWLTERRLTSFIAVRGAK